jgi:transposase InsO family protein
VKSLCCELDISRSLYYAYKKAKPSLRRQEDLALRAEIVRLNATHRWSPGAVKMWRLLNAHGIICGKHRVRRLRKLENIQTSRIKRFRAIQAMQRVQPPAPDLVKRGFNVTVPNTIWVGDITSMRTREGWLHLAIVLDQAHVGAIPLPRAPILRELSRRISRLGMVTDLRRLDGRLVLMVYIPSTHDAGATSYWLESLAIGDGELLIAGETRSTAASRPLTNPPSS